MPGGTRWGDPDQPVEGGDAPGGEEDQAGQDREAPKGRGGRSGGYDPRGDEDTQPIPPIPTRKGG